jgi:hypothetical protein
VAVIAPSFFNACFVVPSVPFFGGGLPFLNIQIFAGGQPSPDPNSHLAPDPSAQPVPFPGSHPMPGVQPVPGANAVTNPPAMPAFAAPVYSAPVYSAPVYGGAAPATMPQVSGGMVIGQTIDDPTFGLRGSSFFGGVACVSRRSLSRTVFIR